MNLPKRRFPSWSFFDAALAAAPLALAGCGQEALAPVPEPVHADDVATGGPSQGGDSGNVSGIPDDDMDEPAFIGQPPPGQEAEGDCLDCQSFMDVLEDDGDDDAFMGAIGGPIGDEEDKPGSGPAVAQCGDDCAPFSIILLPDTQYYTKEKSGEANVYNRQIQWIADNWSRENIKFVIHLGDVTNNNTPSQWQVARNAHKILDDRGLPYSMVTGNHDYIPGDEPVGRVRSHFSEYFGPDHFKGKSWYGGSYDSVSSYSLFEVGSMKFLVMSLEYAPRKEALCWADNVIRKHPDRHVIVATHCYLSHRAGTNNKYAGSCPELPFASNGSRGTDTWNEFVSRHSNIFMVACGHIGDAEYRKKSGNSKNAIHEILVDYQFEKRCTESSASACKDHCKGAAGAGNGWLRQLVFDPRTNTVTSKTFTVMDGDEKTFPGGKPWFFCSEKNTADRNWYSGDPAGVDHQYSFTFDMGKVPAYKYDDSGYQGFNARLINATSKGQQFRPRVAMAKDGHFVAVWEDDSSSADGEGAHDIFARGFFAGGCADSTMPEFTVSLPKESAGDQSSPDIAMDGQGNFVVVWEDDRDGNGTYEIYMRGFNADGSQRFGRKTVNSRSKGQQKVPRIAMAPDGRFNVVWEDYSDDKELPQILMRGFNADGSERFADIHVADKVMGKRRNPAVFLAGDGRSFVAWQDDPQGDGAYELAARGFDAAGNALLKKIKVNSVSAGQQTRPAIGGTPDGRFTVLWEDGKAKNGSYVIMGRTFDANGSPLVDDFTVSGEEGTHTDPDICVNDDGSFRAVWTDDTALDSRPDVFYRAYKADGSPRKEGAKVNHVTNGVQRLPGIGCTPGGDRVVVWEDDNDNNGVNEIYGRGLAR